MNLEYECCRNTSIVFGATWTAGAVHSTTSAGAAITTDTDQAAPAKSVVRQSLGDHFDPTHSTFSTTPAQPSPRSLTTQVHVSSARCRHMPLHCSFPTRLHSHNSCAVSQHLCWLIHLATEPCTSPSTPLPPLLLPSITCAPRRHMPLPFSLRQKPPRILAHGWSLFFRRAHLLAPLHQQQLSHLSNLVTAEHTHRGRFRVWQRPKHKLIWRPKRKKRGSHQNSSEKPVCPTTLVRTSSAREFREGARCSSCICLGRCGRRQSHFADAGVGRWLEQPMYACLAVTF